MRQGVRDLDTQLLADEGKRLVVYPDSLGNPTTGIGHKVRPEDDLRLGEGITDARCASLYAKDKVDAATDLDTHLPWWRMLDECRQGVLLNLCFNMGIGRLLQFHHALAALEVGNWNDAARELMDSKARHQEPERIERLAEQVRSGAWQ